MSDASARRKRMDAKRNKEQRRSTVIWGGIVLVALGLVAVLVWNSIRPALGQEFPIMGGVHISSGDDPGEYNSNPPTSGPHYGRGLLSGFYEDADLAELPPYPQASLVHNLEHGYIVFWYNCDLVDEKQCDDLKDDLRQYLDAPLTVSKLIAFPWKSMDAPLVLTSWGFMLEMEKFNTGQASSFINSNRLNAPEPNAP